MLHHNRTSLDFACVYKIVCKKNGLIYVGQTNNFGHRMREHARSVAQYETTSVWWASVFAKVYGAKDFNEDYDVTILEYFDIDDPAELREELNRSEKYWIKTLNSTDRSIGFNTQSGGWQLCKLPDNKLMRQGFTRKAYYLYDYITGEVALKFSLNAIAEKLNRPLSVIKSYKRLMLLLDERWLILDMAYEYRLATAEKYYVDAIEKINGCDVVGRKAQCILATMMNMRAYIVAENTILLQYPTKVDDSVSTLADESCGVALKNIELWEKRLAKLEVEYIDCASSFIKMADPNNLTRRQFKASITNLPIKVVDVSTNDVRCYTSVSEFMSIMNVTKFNFYKKLKHGTLINKQYLIYFLDNDLRNYFLESVRKYCRGDSARNSIISRYTYGFLITRPQGKLLGLSPR